MQEALKIAVRNLCKRVQVGVFDGVNQRNSGVCTPGLHQPQKTPTMCKVMFPHLEEKVTFVC